MIITAFQARNVAVWLLPILVSVNINLCYAFFFPFAKPSPQVVLRIIRPQVDHVVHAVHIVQHRPRLDESAEAFIVFQAPALDS